MTLSNKDYVAFTRRFVKETAENMDIKELRDFYINAMHEDIQDVYDDLGQRGAFEDMSAWNCDVFDDVAKDYDLTLDDDFEDDDEL